MAPPFVLPSQPAKGNPSIRIEDAAKAPTEPRKKRASGAKAHAQYHDRHEEYVLVTRDDLREIRAFGKLQQGLMASGTFFFSGAFWLLISLLAGEARFKPTAWMGMCILSMAFGIALVITGFVIYKMREGRLNKYFGNEHSSKSAPS